MFNTKIFQKKKKTFIFWLIHSQLQGMGVRGKVVCQPKG